MDEKNKKAWGHDLKMIALLGLGVLAILSSVGCFNYATLAREAGNPDNLFWLVGIVNLAYNAFIIYRIVKMLPKEEKKDKQ